MTLITIIDGGLHIRHNANFRMKRNNGVPEFLLLFVKTEAIFFLNGQEKMVAPQSVVLVNRRTAYEYFNPNGEYIDSWLHFDIQQDSYEQRFQSIVNQFFVCRHLPQLEMYLQQLLWEKAYASKQHKTENTHFLFQILMNNLLDAYDQRENTVLNHPYYRSFQDLRLMVQSNPKETFSAKAIADSLNISVSHFHHLYKEFFQTTFRNELITFRIDLAKNLLETTDLTIEEIIETCGYKNSVHFFRQFKEQVKMTPTAYRIQHESKPPV